MTGTKKLAKSDKALATLKLVNSNENLNFMSSQTNAFWTHGNNSVHKYRITSVVEVV